MKRFLFVLYVTIMATFSGAALAMDGFTKAEEAAIERDFGVILDGEFVGCSTLKKTVAMFNANPSFGGVKWIAIIPGEMLIEDDVKFRDAQSEDRPGAWGFLSLNFGEGRQLSAIIHKRSTKYESGGETVDFVACRTFSSQPGIPPSYRGKVKKVDIKTLNLPEADFEAFKALLARMTAVIEARMSGRGA